MLPRTTGPTAMNSRHRRNFQRHGWEVDWVPEMRCPICEVAVTDGVMRVSLGRSLLRCVRCGVHVVIGRPGSVLSLVKSSIGLITFPRGNVGQ